VAWEDSRNGNKDIYGTRLTASGSIVALDGAASGIPIVTVAQDQSAPAVAFDGLSYLVAWADKRTYTNSDIYAGRVSTAGAVLDGSGFAIKAGLPRYRSPALACKGTPADGCLLVYEADDLAAYTNRLKGVIVKGGAGNGASCTVGNDCATGYCVDSVCCDTACGVGDLYDCQACSVAAGSSSNGTCGLRSAGVVCSPATVSPCDAPDLCDGVSSACSAYVAVYGTICRWAAGPCDALEKCNGYNTLCPSDQTLPDNTPCPAGACQSGVCIPAPSADAGVPDGSADGASSGDGSGPAKDGAPGSDGPPSPEGGSVESGTEDSSLIGADFAPDLLGTPLDAGLADAATADLLPMLDAASPTPDGAVIKDHSVVDLPRDKSAAPTADVASVQGDGPASSRDSRVDVTPQPTPPDDGSGGCMVASAEARSPGGCVLWLVVLAAVGLRCRRSRRRPAERSNSRSRSRYSRS
jgi:hypothetical protein